MIAANWRSSRRILIAAVVTVCIAIPVVCIIWLPTPDFDSGPSAADIHASKDWDNCQTAAAASNRNSNEATVFSLVCFALLDPDKSSEPVPIAEALKPGRMQAYRHALALSMRNGESLDTFLSRMKGFQP
jgi:hypothetical protein